MSQVRLTERQRLERNLRQALNQFEATGKPANAKPVMAAALAMYEARCMSFADFQKYTKGKARV